MLELRRRGRRVLAGDLRQPKRPTNDQRSAEVTAVFAGRVPLILLDNFEAVPPARRHSASIVELTGPAPLVVREGSVPAAELRAELRRVELGELVVPPDVRRV